MRDALARPPAVVLIEGEAGIGKTRLVREALAGRPDRGARILSGSCPPLREPFPYGPLFDVLRTLAGQVPAGLSPVCGALRPYLPELAERLPPACEPLHDHAAATHRIFRAVGALLSAVCPANPAPAPRTAPTGRGGRRPSAVGHRASDPGYRT